jgi:hypothetical protein
VSNQCDIISFTVVCFYPVYYLKYEGISKSYPSQIWYIYFNKFVRDSTLISSGLLEIAATLDCAVSIRNKFKLWQSTKGFILTTFIILILPPMYHIHFWWFYKVELIPSIDSIQNGTIYNSTKKAYQVGKYPLFDEQRGKDMRIVHSIVRDVVTPIALVIINVYILLTLRKLKKNKSTLQSTSSNQNTISSSVVSNAQRAENKKFKMIIILCINYIIGHSFVLVYYMSFNDGGIKWFFVHAFGDIFFYSSYITPFFIYYYFNNIFTKFVNEKFHCCCKKEVINSRDTLQSRSVHVKSNQA